MEPPPGSTPTATHRVPLPPTTPPGVEYFNPAGAYLIDNGRLVILWLGQQLPPGWYTAAFGVAAPPHDTSGLCPEPARPGSELSARLCAVLRQLRAGQELHQVRVSGGGDSSREKVVGGEGGREGGRVMCDPPVLGCGPSPLV